MDSYLNFQIFQHSGKKLAEMRKLNAPLEKKIQKQRQSLESADAKMKELKDVGNATVKRWKNMYDRLEKEQEKVEEVKQVGKGRTFPYLAG